MFLKCILLYFSLNKKKMVINIVKYFNSCRLSQGHARLMFRENVLVQDAIVAISLVESSMLGTALIGEVDTLHSSFPTDAVEEYKKQGNFVTH